MAPKKREHSTDLRSLVIEHFLHGDSYAVIAKKVLIPRPTVQSIIQKYKRTKCIVNLPGRGRKRKTTAVVDRIIQRKIKVDRRKSTSVVRSEIENELGVSVHTNTIRNRLHEIGFYGRVARKKPLVNKVNRVKRIAYAKTMMKMPFVYWEKVLWSDESKFNLFRSDGKSMVWRTPGEEFDPKCTVPTVKYNGGSVMVWGCFARSGVGNLYFIDGILDRFRYREILEENLLRSAQKLGLDEQFVFQHDNDPKHTSGIVKEWLKEKKVETLKWPAFSPDLNPIEHIWDELERRMKKHHPTNREMFKEMLLREWNSIGVDVTEKLVDSVPNRLYECVRGHGYPTRY
jgi:transposase